MSMLKRHLTSRHLFRPPHAGDLLDCVPTPEQQCFSRIPSVDRGGRQDTQHLVILTHPNCTRQRPPTRRDRLTMTAKKRTALEALDANGGDLCAEYADALAGALVDMNADQVRRKIRSFIDSGAMTTGEFQNAIGVNSKGYHTFMTQTGRNKGLRSNTFHNAWVYFKARELERLPMPKKPRVTGPKAGATSKAAVGAGEEVDKENADGEAASGGSTTKRSKSQATAAKSLNAIGAPDVSDITLAGEENDDVTVYDSCDEIRRKINAHLKLPGVTQASFLRLLAAQYHTRDIKIQGKQLSDFRGKKGATSGNTSAVYRAAYTYFEKLRLKAKRPKSKHRLEVEATRPGGFDTEKIARWVSCSADEYIVEDHRWRVIWHRY